MPESCQRLPEYARVLQNMPEYARECQSMPEYARVCQSMPEYARKCQSCQSKDDEEDVLDDIGAELDPENEQEVGEVKDEGILEHPEYAHLDPDEVDDNAAGSDRE